MRYKLVLYETNTLMYKSFLEYTVVYNTLYWLTSSNVAGLSCATHDYRQYILESVWDKNPTHWESIYQFSLTPWSIYYE